MARYTAKKEYEASKTAKKGLSQFALISGTTAIAISAVAKQAGFEVEPIVIIEVSTIMGAITAGARMMFNWFKNRNK